MAYSVNLGILFLLAVGCHTSFAWPSSWYGQSKDSRAVTDVNCTADGYLCSVDCGTVYQCLGTTGTYLMIKVQTCDTKESYYCNKYSGSCSSTFANSCDPPEYQFECTSVGVFPDPYNCAIYHECYGSDTDTTLSTEQCPTGWLYDPLDMSCSKKGTTCTTPPVPTCTVENSMGPIEANPNLYYICDKNGKYGYLYPVLYACPHGGEFDATLKSCVDKAITYSTTTTTTTTTTTKPTTTTQTTTKPTTTTQTTTKPTTTTQTTTKPTTTTRTTTKPTTTTQTTTKPTTTTQTTSKPTTTTRTTAKPTTTTQTTAKPTTSTKTTTSNPHTTPGGTITCPGKGIYADPSDCESYYWCPSNGGRPCHHHCEYGYHYNDVIKDCLLGPCIEKC